MNKAIKNMETFKMKGIESIKKSLAQKYPDNVFQKKMSSTK